MLVFPGRQRFLHPHLGHRNVKTHVCVEGFPPARSVCSGLFWSVSAALSFCFKSSDLDRFAKTYFLYSQILPDILLSQERLLHIKEGSNSHDTQFTRHQKTYSCCLLVAAVWQHQGRAVPLASFNWPQKEAVAVICMSVSVNHLP